MIPVPTRLRAHATLLALALLSAGCQVEEAPLARREWVPVPGAIGAKSVAASPDGDLYVTAEPMDWQSWSIYRHARPDTTWELLFGNAFWVSAGADGELWGICRYDELWRRAGGQWGQVGYAMDVAIGAGGHVFKLDVGATAEGTPVRQWLDREGAGWDDLWSPVLGYASKLAVAPNGDLWTLTPTGAIRRYSQGGWTEVPGLAADITVAGDGVVYILASTAGPGSEVLAWNGRRWQPRLQGPRLVDIAGASPTGLYGVAMESGAAEGRLLFARKP